MNLSFALFHTAVGVCAIVWGRRGIAGLRLPEASEAAQRARVARRWRDAIEEPPRFGVDLAIRDIQRHFDGGAVDLTRIELDMEGVAAFERGVYDAARTIPVGETRTYGEIARQLGDVALARRVGQALGRNPFPIVVPCHRVLAANGGTGGFTAPGGVATKFKMLAIERARFGANPSLFDAAGGLPLAIAR